MSNGMKLSGPSGNRPPHNYKLIKANPIMDLINYRDRCWNEYVLAGDQVSLARFSDKWVNNEVTAKYMWAGVEFRKVDREMHLALDQDVQRDEH